MTLSLAQDAIALLIDLAERGEIDPWDVKVIDVIDRFLSELAPTVTIGREQYESNLSQSGQAFLYASMLLLLKADSITDGDPVAADEEFDDADILDGADFGSHALPLNLERQLRRRAVAQPPRNRRVTLKELIDQLQLIAEALEDKAPRSPIHRPKKQTRSQAVKAIAALAHQENLSEMAVAIEQFFLDHWTDVAQGQDWIDFDLVLEFWVALKTQRPQDPEEAAHAAHPNHERVGVFWALLLLSAQSKVELAQEEFYQDLRVKSLLLSDGLTEMSSLVD
ncbi:MAG: segregation/condensation protein A [Leptolyngbyaceae cyanobacterium CSU_1_3]|nr:segregation/condensation protein A [Leptolyngbyaceae cyanobacterium CSU_1_3]